MAFLAIVIAVVVLCFIMLIGSYNRLISLRNQWKNSFSQIDVQLKRRYDLIPNLVETAKTYMKHERETLEAVIAARNSAFTANQAAATNPQDPQAMKQLFQAEASLTDGLGKLMAVMESYPDLKANQNMMQLTEELTSTENKISFARQAFNDSIMIYNTAVESFPSSLIAGVFQFQPGQLYVIEDTKMKEAPKVSFT